MKRLVILTPANSLPMGGRSHVSLKDRGDHVEMGAYDHGAEGMVNFLDPAGGRFIPGGTLKLLEHWERGAKAMKPKALKPGVVRKMMVVVALMMGYRGIAFAAEDKPAADPVSVEVSGGALVTLSGDSGTAYTPTTFVEVDGPLVLGKTSHGRFFFRLGITSLPGENVDLSSVETFRAAEVAFGATKIIGQMEIAGQKIATSLVGEWGFLSRTPGADIVEGYPLERLVRHYGVGLRLEERNSGDGITILLGRDESAGPLGLLEKDEASGVRSWGQWMVYGQVTVPKTESIVRIVGDATLAVGRAPGKDFPDSLRQRDILRLGVIVDGGSVLDLFKGDKK